MAKRNLRSRKRWVGYDKILTHKKPPVSILDLLHDYESYGGKIDSAIDAWWRRETEISESKGGVGDKCE